MLEKIEEHIKYRSEAANLCEKLKAGLEALEYISNSDGLSDDLAGMHDMTECKRILNNYLEQLTERRKYNQDMIYDLRKQCNHKWVYLRPTPYHDVYKCELCGEHDFVK